MVANRLTDGLGQLCNGEIAAIADVDVAAHGRGVGSVGCISQIHDEDTGSGHVVHIQKLAFWGAGSPDDHFGRARLLSLVKATNQCRDDVAVLRVVVVARAIEVGGHYAAVVAAMLAVVAFAQLDSGYFGNGIGLVGGLQGAGQQGALRHGLLRHARVDATGAQEQQLLHVMDVGCVDDVGLHHEVFIDEVCGVDIVCIDAAHFGSGQVDLGRLLGVKECVDAGLVAQVKLGMGAMDDLTGQHALGQQGANNCAADHAAVARDEYFDRLFVHTNVITSVCQLH